jgi:hypothetical protein
MANEYEVGFGKPPKEHQFQKGQSGNPKGRPKGTRNLKTDLADELAECILIREGERRIKVSKQRALIKSLTAKALQGDTRAATLLLNMVWKTMEATPPETTVVDLSAEDLAILESFADRQASKQPQQKGDQS